MKKRRIAVKLTLLHKGLILVCIPLCFEIFVFSYLISAQNHLELEAQKINRNKKINDQVNLIFSDMFDVVNRVRSSSEAPAVGAFSPKKIFASFTDLKKRFDELEVLSQDEPALLHDIQQGKAEINQAYDTIRLMKVQLLKADSADFPRIFHDSSTAAESHLQRLMDLGVFDWASKNQVEREELRRGLWLQIRIVLECGMALSLLFAVAGCFFLSKQLVKRASRLTKNAVLLGQDKPLMPPLDGSDELAQLDKNFHQAHDLLEAAKRMRQEVTAMITHDLRTPLQTVLGFLEMLGSSQFGELNAMGHRLLKLTMNSCHHMSNLIDNVLQLEKLRSGTIRLNTSQVELRAFLEKCVSSIQLVADEKNILIALNESSAPSESIDIDPFWMEQVVINILSNAVKFSPKGSCVTVSASKEGRRLVIRIKDEGPGIPADQQTLIFNRFHRMNSSSATPGTGLGLAIAKELIELHKGSIGVESAEGHGSMFLLKLPLSKSVGKTNPKITQTSQAITSTQSIPKLEQTNSDKKKPALKLFHKGLILVSIPLCFEVTIFGLLLNLQNQVEQEANRISHNAQVNDAANIVTRDLMHVAFALRRHQRKTESNQISANQYRLWYSEILTNLRILELLVDTQDPQNQLKSGERGVQMLAQKLESQSRDIALREQVISDLLSMMNYMAKRSVQTELDLHGSELRSQSRSLLELAILMSVLFSCLGAIWYSKQIVDRLKNVSKNSELLAAGEPLLAPVRGSDEIAELDKTFHEAAAQIEAAKKIRQEATVMITHDLKTPLQSSRNFMEMLSDGTFGDIDENGTKLRISSRNAIQRMEDLINSVLQLEKLRSGSLKLETAPVAIAPIIDKCLASLKVLADKKEINLSRNYQNLDYVHVDGDAFWLEQVLVNLLSNAIKFSDKHKTVTITMEKQDQQIGISITDEGMGIEPENLDLIFVKYYRPESAALIPGTGLGLPIAKELIELHHGTIIATSTIGSGSTFAIRLPLAIPD